MTTQRVWNRRRSDDERGAALVEFALIAPVFFMMVLGMFSGGRAYDQKSSMTAAAREGARYATTRSIASAGSVDAWIHDTANYIQDASSGTLGGTATGSEICVAYVYNPAAGDQTKHEIHYGGGTTTGIVTGPCPDANDAPADATPRVQVVVKRPGFVEALFWKYNFTMTAQSITRFEAA